MVGTNPTESPSFKEDLQARSSKNEVSLFTRVAVDASIVVPFHLAMEDAEPIPSKALIRSLFLPCVDEVKQDVHPSRRFPHTRGGQDQGSWVHSPRPGASRIAILLFEKNRASLEESKKFQSVPRHSNNSVATDHRKDA